MKRIAVVISSPAHLSHEELAGSALQEVGNQLGHQLDIEAASQAEKPLSPSDILAADVVLIASDTQIDLSRFVGKAVYSTSTAETIRHTRSVLDAAISLAPAGAPVSSTTFENSGAKENESSVSPPSSLPVPKRLVAITSCPTGIAHTFMAAQALQKAAKSQGYEIKVETQGSVGSQDKLTGEDIARADAVIIAADVNIDLSRFGGKALYSTGTKEAMGHGVEVIEKALAQPKPAGGDLASRVEDAKASRAAQRSGPYKHLMTGVSHMLPLVVAGGLCIALAFAFGGINVVKPEAKDTFGGALFSIGGPTAFGLIVAVFSAFIAYSIADRPGLVPGLIGGMLASSLGAGFLGGIVSGFLAGYLTAFLAKSIVLPRNLEGLKPVLILPLLTALIVGLSMIYIIAPPVAFILKHLTAFLTDMRSSNAALLGFLLGGMMAFDMGGPVNKAAYTFSITLLPGIGGPAAAVIAAGMTPPLALALAATLFPNRFDEDEREARGPAFVLGLAFITEGAIPFAAKDPLRVIPALMAGSAITGAISMGGHVTSQVPHGGVFAAIIPHAFNGLPVWALAIAAGTLVSTGALFALKRPLTSNTDLVAVQA